MPPTKTRVLLLAAVLLLAPRWACARTTFILEIHHDDVTVRGYADDVPESLEARGLLWLMANLATADRSQKTEGVEVPYCFENLSREQLRKKLGQPVEFKEEPSRGTLTDPPTGLRTPSPKYTYGTKNALEPTKNGPADTAVGSAEK